MPEIEGSQADRARQRRSLSLVLAGLSRALRREMLKELEEIGVDIREWTNLAFLEERPGSSNAELARRIGVSPQAAHTVTLRLERRHLIVRQPDPNHGRIARFTLTTAGTNVLGECNAIAAHVERGALSDLDADERRHLLSSALIVLRRLGLPEKPDAEHGAAGHRRAGKPKGAPKPAAESGAQPSSVSKK